MRDEGGNGGAEDRVSVRGVETVFIVRHVEHIKSGYGGARPFMRHL